MPRRRRRDPRRAAGDGRPDRAHEVHLARDRQAPRRPARLGRAARLRLARGEPDPRRHPGLGEVRARCRPTCGPRCRAPRRSPTRSGSRRGRTTTSRSFLPVLRKNLDLRKRYIECFDVGDEPYDIVLDDYERGMKTKEVRRIFDYLKEHQAPLVKEVAANGGGAAPNHDFDARAAEGLRARGRARVRLHRRRVAARSDGAPVRLRHGRRPTSASRRATSLTTSTASSGRCTSSATGSTSARSTRRSSARRSPAASRSACTSRRAGCGRTSSAARCRSGGASSRACRSCIRRLSAATTPSSGTARSTRSSPSLIRVEADEATYNLHIILRFELEQAMLADEFPLEQLPEEWNRRMWDYLGIEVPNDTEGVLQDVHWSGGSIGYFPTYALGNLISAQIWEKITADLPDLDGAIRARASSARSATGCASTCIVTGASSRRARRSSASSGRRRSTPSRTCATSARSSRRSTALPSSSTAA